jgi:hypothetical protein
MLKFLKKSWPPIITHINYMFNQTFPLFNKNIVFVTWVNMG